MVADMKNMLAKYPLMTALFGFFVLYGFLYLGIASLLFGIAGGLIAYGFDVKMEISVAIMIICGLLYPYIAGFLKGKEGFTASVKKVAKGKEGFSDSVKKTFAKNAKEGFEAGLMDDVMVTQDGSLTQIIKRIQGLQSMPGVQGVLSASFAEGFADAGSESQGESATSAEDKPAPVNATSVSQILQKTLETQQSAPAVQKAVAESVAKEKTKSGFQNGKAGEFKLGEIPTELEGGIHIDAGTTLMNALKSLNPDQIKSMTDDTQKLMETQKSLMGMLSTMKPMLSDGKQLLDTFNDMFGKQ